MQQMMNKKISLRSMLLMIGISLFLHVLHWVIYEIIAFSWMICLITPLLLCLCYHGFQTDCEGTFGISRKQVFLGTVLIPFLMVIAVSVLLFINDPHMGLYAPNGQLTGSVPEKIALYAGRTVLSGLYVLIFSVIDIPILHWQDGRRYVKESSRLTESDLSEKQVYQNTENTVQSEEDEPV